MTANDQLHQDHIEEIIHVNCRIKLKEIANKLGIFKEKVGYVIGALEFCKVCA